MADQVHQPSDFLTSEDLEKISLFFDEINETLHHEFYVKRRAICSVRLPENFSPLMSRIAVKKIQDQGWEVELDQGVRLIFLL